LFYRGQNNNAYEKKIAILMLNPKFVLLSKFSKVKSKCFKVRNYYTNHSRQFSGSPLFHPISKWQKKIR